VALLVVLLGAVGTPVALHSSAAAAQADTVFRHADHTDLQCVRCHSDGGVHGQTLIRRPSDCRSCHHTGPAASTCATCHREEAGSLRLFRVIRTLAVPGDRESTRTMSFQHAAHVAIDCASCHGAPPDVGATPVECVGCHADHHQGGAECSACHLPGSSAAHPLAAHAGCSGSGCHESDLVAELPRTRASCLVCHQDQRDHRAGAECAGCHLLPAPGPSGTIGLSGFGVRK